MSLRSMIFFYFTNDNTVSLVLIQQNRKVLRIHDFLDEEKEGVINRYEDT